MIDHRNARGSRFTDTDERKRDIYGFSDIYNIGPWLFDAFFHFRTYNNNIFQTKDIEFLQSHMTIL